MGLRHFLGGEQSDAEVFPHMYLCASMIVHLCIVMFVRGCLCAHLHARVCIHVQYLFTTIRLYPWSEHLRRHVRIYQNRMSQHLQVQASAIPSRGVVAALGARIVARRRAGGCVRTCVFVHL